MGARDGIGKMVLGGVQFGLEYGITNTTGQIPSSAVERILLAANAAGVAQIDTAHGYGDSESAIGQALQAHPELSFRVITKLSPMAELDANSAAAAILAEVDASVSASIDRLGKRPLDTVMLHRASHFLDWEGAAWERLRTLQHQGEINTLGVSVQNPAELMLALAEDAVSIIQLPFNLLDWRWQEICERIQEVKRSRKVEIHARSALLQGLLTTSDRKFWHQANVDNSLSVTDWIQQTAIRYTDGNIVRLCIEYVRAQDWIDGVVIGVANLAQLEENTTYFSTPIWSSAMINEVEHERPVLSENTLNPALWR